MDLKDFLARKEELDRCKRDHGKAQGRLEVALQQLHARFGCSTEAQGGKKLLLLKKEAEHLEALYQKQLAGFACTYGDRLAN